MGGPETGMDQALKDALNRILGSRAVLVLTQIAVGVGLMYLIDKFSKFVEEKLTDDTKPEIAVWLLGVRVGPKVEPWPDTFAKLFDRVFSGALPSELQTNLNTQVAAPSIVPRRAERGWPASTECNHITLKLAAGKVYGPCFWSVAALRCSFPRIS